MSIYPTRPGYYYRNGRWYPSKKSKKQRAKDRLIREVSEQIHLFPEKYPYNSFALSQAAAKRLGLEVWWQKCKKGHLVERKVTESSCPVCSRITRDLRDKRISEAKVKLSNEEVMRLHEIYRKAQKLTKETGVPHHVDHIRPLAAGGVHHPDNLQVITAEENLLKGSTYKGRKANYSKIEKRQAHLDFMQKRKLKEQETIMRLAEEKKKREARSTYIFIGIISFILLFFYFA